MQEDKMRPIIAITLDVDNEKTNKLLGAYVSAIEHAGGIPLLIPYTEQDEALDVLLNMCSGVLFTGGKDINPELYGEKRLDTCGEIAPLRDEIELRAFNKIINTDKPILAICRGAQLINVALGGTLYQDISSQIDTPLHHVQREGRYEFSHEVYISEGTPLFALMGKDRIRANSFHHQAIKRLGRGLKAMASAPDGIIEAVYLDGSRYLRAYQWHPERLCASDTYNQKIFSDFIEECIKYEG